RGEGGWGGERGPSTKVAMPDRAPDHEVTYQTRVDQALLYRLSGDRNPLHSDPKFAALAGFDRPILHGLCTYGFTGRALLHTLCGSDPALFRSMAGRLSSPVFPGEPLTVRIWVGSPDQGPALVQTVSGDGRPVLRPGLFPYRHARAPARRPAELPVARGRGGPAAGRRAVLPLGPAQNSRSSFGSRPRSAS